MALTSIENVSSVVMNYYEKVINVAISEAMIKQLKKMGKDIAKEVTTQMLNNYDVRLYIKEKPENPKEIYIGIKLIPKEQYG